MLSLNMLAAIAWLSIFILMLSVCLRLNTVMPHWLIGFLLLFVSLIYVLNHLFLVPWLFYTITPGRQPR